MKRAGRAGQLLTPLCVKGSNVSIYDEVQASASAGFGRSALCPLVVVPPFQPPCVCLVCMAAVGGGHGGGVHGAPWACQAAGGVAAAGAVLLARPGSAASQGQGVPWPGLQAAARQATQGPAAAAACWGTVTSLPSRACPAHSPPCCLACASLPCAGSSVLCCAAMPGPLGRAAGCGAAARQACSSCVVGLVTGEGQPGDVGCTSIPAGRSVPVAQGGLGICRREGRGDGRRPPRRLLRAALRDCTSSSAVGRAPGLLSQHLGEQGGAHNAWGAASLNLCLRHHWVDSEVGSRLLQAAATQPQGSLMQPSSCAVAGTRPHCRSHTICTIPPHLIHPH
ncbi:hypothetical protein HaLaN_10152 [Haematococcus lacustris]|uniref:Uncharacterized protein n=1 Tax=Haematococcus lacustris TaxID=44745 RepID=A0A699Z5G1_HAELA|nr:hypothetical protein HaLaN_10152 [Haematococcus lacustris]